MVSLKALRILAALDGIDLHADDLDAVLLEDAGLGELGQRLSADWPPRLGSRASGRSLAMISLEALDVERLDVHGVGRGRVGHDRGGVGVHEHDLVAQAAQRLAGLGAGVVELAGLADDDGATSDDQDLVDVGSLTHGDSFYESGQKTRGRDRVKIRRRRANLRYCRRNVAPQGPKRHRFTASRIRLRPDRPQPGSATPQKAGSRPQGAQA